MYHGSVVHYFVLLFSIQSKLIAGRIIPAIGLVCLEMYKVWCVWRCIRCGVSVCVCVMSVCLYSEISLSGHLINKATLL